MAWPFSLLRWSADDPAARQLPPPRGIGNANHEFPSRPAVQPGAALSERRRHEGREEHMGSNSACQTTHPPTHTGAAWGPGLRHSLIDLSLWRGPRSAPPAPPASPEPQRRGPRTRGGAADGSEPERREPSGRIGPGGAIYATFSHRKSLRACENPARFRGISRTFRARVGFSARDKIFPHAHKFFIVRQNLGPPPGAIGAQPRPRTAGPSSDPPSHPHAHSGAGGPRGSDSRRL